MQTNKITTELNKVIVDEQGIIDIDEFSQLYNKLTVSSDRLRAANKLRTTRYKNFISGKHSNFKTIKLSILSNFTTTFIEDYLYAYFITNGLKLKTQPVEYNQYVQQLLDLSSEYYQFKPDVTLLLLDEHIIINELPNTWNIKQLDKAIKEKINQLGKLVALHKKHGNGTIIINTIPLSHLTLNEIIDYATKAQLSILWAQFNNSIHELTRRYKNVLTIDTNILLQSQDVVQLRDERLSQHAKMHFDNSLLDAIARETALITKTVLGETCKCLVVDLDETLWGGILGDDGIDNIKLGHIDEGEAYRRFQSTIKQLQSQGVILAISSKNDLDLVKKAFTKHHDMVLTLDNFVSIKANWEPKHKNIKEIAKQLNIGRDGIVFVDDNPAECGLVEDQLPEVKTLCLGNDVYDFRKILLSTGLFNRLNITAEDKKRSQLYKEENQRKDFLDACHSITDFLWKLDIKVIVEPLAHKNIQRASQLSMRTNQFNMTGIRYSEAQLSTMLAKKTHLIWTIRTFDKFGSNGIVGLIALKPKERDRLLVIENFILSCRVFSRGIEDLMLAEVLGYARLSGFIIVGAEYISFTKNHKIKDFYLKHGFEIKQESKSKRAYFHKLNKVAAPPPWITVEQRCFGESDDNNRRT